MIASRHTLDWLKRRTLAAAIGALLIFAGAAAQAQQPAQQIHPGGFQTRVYQDDAGSHKYSIFLPRGYSTKYKWPAILFLHGAGERGTDGVLPTTMGLGPLVKLRAANFPFIVVFPQNEEVHGRILNGWDPAGSEGARALKILEQVEQDYSVDTKREILTGWSMGGFGAWQMAAAYPEKFMSVVSISGGGDPALAEKLKNVPIRAFHGGRDHIVKPDGARALVEAVNAAGGDAQFTEIPEGDNNVWAKVFDDDRLYAWMIYPKSSDPAKLKPFTSRPQPAAGQTASVIPEVPFVPALDMPRAVYVRMGNDMLATLADSIPRVVPRESLTGWLNNISDYTEAEGYGFQVYMSGLSYSAQLYRANVKAYAKDRLNIQLGLSNVHVTIGGTSLQGESHSANAGPMSVVIGHVRPVWLTFDVTPTVVDRKLKLQLVGTNFSIPHDNWYVSGPAGVSVSGFGMTRDKVSNGLVSGIYSRKGTIEQQVSSVVPGLLKQMEDKLDVSQMGQAVSNIWPLPVYQPRLRMWPQEVSTDDKGVSLVMGVTAATVDPLKSPKSPRVVPASGPSVAQVPKVTKLQVGLSPDVLGPLTELMVDADVARIHVADTPSPSMAKLADPAVIAEAIPDLKRYGDRLQVTSELILAGPIQVIDLPPATSVAAGTQPSGGDGATTAATTQRQFAFDAPKVKILVSIKTEPGEAKWKPCAEFDLSLRQGATAELLKPNFQTRAVAVHWTDKAQIEAKGQFVEGYTAQETALDVEKLKSLFEAGWEEYVRGGMQAKLDLPDIDLGYTKLRADDVTWAPPTLSASFAAAGLKITNSSDQTLVYETKGPYSNWGGPYSLKPGASHEFPIAYPMGFRRQSGGTYQAYSLPAGSHSEYWSPKAGSPVGLYQARDPDEIEKTASGSKETAAKPEN